MIRYPREDVPFHPKLLIILLAFGQRLHLPCLPDNLTLLNVVNILSLPMNGIKLLPIAHNFEGNPAMLGIIYLEENSRFITFLGVNTLKLSPIVMTMISSMFRESM